MFQKLYICTRRNTSSCRYTVNVYLQSIFLQFVTDRIIKNYHCSNTNVMNKQENSITTSWKQKLGKTEISYCCATSFLIRKLHSFYQKYIRHRVEGYCISWLLIVLIIQGTYHFWCLVISLAKSQHDTPTMAYFLRKEEKPLSSCNAAVDMLGGSTRQLTTTD